MPIIHNNYLFKLTFPDTYQLSFVMIRFLTVPYLPEVRKAASQDEVLDWRWIARGKNATYQPVGPSFLRFHPLTQEHQEYEHPHHACLGLDDGVHRFR